MGYEKFIIMLFIAWVTLYILFPYIGMNFPAGLFNGSRVIDIFNQTTFIEPIINSTKNAYAIELRNGRILRCTDYEETPCGMKLTGCHNNVTYSCMRDVKILV